MGGAARSHQPARLWMVIGIVLLSVMSRGPSAASLSRYVVALEAEASAGAHTEPPIWRQVPVGRHTVRAAPERPFCCVGGSQYSPPDHMYSHDSGLHMVASGERYESDGRRT
jgi:hypothetical protein